MQKKCRGVAIPNGGQGIEEQLFGNPVLGQLTREHLFGGATIGGGNLLFPRSRTKLDQRRELRQSSADAPALATGSPDAIPSGDQGFDDKGSQRRIAKARQDRLGGQGQYVGGKPLGRCRQQVNESAWTAEARWLSLPVSRRLTQKRNRRFCRQPSQTEHRLLAHFVTGIAQKPQRRGEWHCRRAKTQAAQRFGADIAG